MRSFPERSLLLPALIARPRWSRDRKIRVMIASMVIASGSLGVTLGTMLMRRTAVTVVMPVAAPRTPEFLDGNRMHAVESTEAPPQQMLMPSSDYVLTVVPQAPVLQR